MELEVHKHRSGLTRTLRALESGSITIGFIGGSITESKGVDRWPEYVTSWFVEKFPEVRINVENAAIGATGSDLAVFRADRDIISRNCDIVFIEYAVNDYEVPREKRSKTREGLIRKLLHEEGRDLVLIYTFCQGMYSDMVNGIQPSSINEFEELAEYYKIGSVWVGLHALNEVKNGWMRWQEWLPDGLHPGHRGSMSYAGSVIQYLEKELISEAKQEGIPCEDKLPRPLNEMNWEKTYMLPFENIKLQGPWKVSRWANLKWIDRIIDTAAVGAKLSFEFEGRGLALGFDFGMYSSEFRYRLDGSAWIDIARERPLWCGNQGWFIVTLIGDDFDYCIHEFELEVTHGNNENCKGTDFRMAFAGVII